MSTRYFAVPYDLPYVGIELIAEHDGRLPAKFIARGGLPDTAVEITKEQYAIRGIAKGDQLKLVDGVPVKLTQDEYNAVRDEHYFDQEVTKKINKIDAKTKALIEEGFDFDGKHFSLSSTAQMNWIALTMATAPAIISTDDSFPYTLETADAIRFFQGTARTVVQHRLQSGRELKLQVHAATTSAELDAIIDNRT